MDKYTATHQMRLLQERAEADPALAEAVVAYTRLCTDRGVEPVFFAKEEAEQVIAESPFYQQAFIERNSHLDTQVKGFFMVLRQLSGKKSQGSGIEVNRCCNYTNINHFKTASTWSLYYVPCFGKATLCINAGSWVKGICCSPWRP